MKDLFSIPLYHENILDADCGDGRKVRDVNQSVIDDCTSYHLARKENLGDTDTTHQVLMRTGSQHDMNGEFIKDPPGVCTCMDPVQEWPALERAITREVTNYVNSISKFSRLKKEGDWFNYTWFSVFEREDTYPWHDHNLYFVSCVYYPTEGPGNMPILFKSPISSLINTWWPGPTFGHPEVNRWNQEIMIYPKKGDLIIFPSWLEHTVNKAGHGLSEAPKFTEMSFGHAQTIQHDTNDDPYRISISGNYGVKEVIDGFPK